MFGEHKIAELPVLLDIAKKVRDASSNRKSKTNIVNDMDDDIDSPFIDYNASHEGRAQRRSRSVQLNDYNGGKSYHEWKMNMTDFRGTRESNDQQAIESETQLHLALPNATVTAMPLATTTLTLEEIENLAFADLNGTSATGVADAKNSITNGTTDDENLPEPEMLIRPYRLRPRPIAERFDNLYLYVSDYPL